MIDRYYQCTCCGAKETEPGRKCSCSDEKCPECPRCTFCCKSPGTHSAHARRKVSESPITRDDHAYLSLMKISWDGDNRPQGRAA